MNLPLKYEPNVGFFHKGDDILWGADQDTVRQQLAGVFEAQELTFEDVVLFRDIYRNLDGAPVLLFLNYNNQRKLVELEIHQGIELDIKSQLVYPGMSFFDAVDNLGKLSAMRKSIDEGEELFVDLRICLSAAATMGGEQDDFTLSYIYCGKDVDHLLT